MSVGEGEVIWAVRFLGKSSSPGNFHVEAKTFFGQQCTNSAQKTMSMAPDQDWVIVYSGVDTKSILPPHIDDLFQ